MFALLESEVKATWICTLHRFHAQSDESGTSLCHYDQQLWVWKGLLPQDEPGTRASGVLKDKVSPNRSWRRHTKRENEEGPVFPRFKEMSAMMLSALFICQQTVIRLERLNVETKCELSVSVALELQVRMLRETLGPLMLCVLVSHISFYWDLLRGGGGFFFDFFLFQCLRGGTKLHQQRSQTHICPHIFNWCVTGDTGDSLASRVIIPILHKHSTYTKTMNLPAHSLE